MATMSDPRELLLHGLRDVLYAENLLVKALPRMSREASDEQLAAMLDEHLAQTREHVRNVKQAFQLLGKKASAEPCPGIEGIKAEHDQFSREEDPTPQVRDIFLTGAGSRAEHYEIAAYTSLLTLARSLGERDVVKLLEANLREEKEALRKLESAARRLGKVARQAVAA